MEITIMCDQKDCLYNAGHNVHHDHPNDRCEHQCPHFIPALGLTGKVCGSKQTGVTRTGALLPTNPKVG